MINVCSLSAIIIANSIQSDLLALDTSNARVMFSKFPRRRFYRATAPGYVASRIRVSGIDRTMKVLTKKEKEKNMNEIGNR